MSERLSRSRMDEIRDDTHELVQDIDDLLAHISALEAENERLNQLSVDLRACMVEARHKLGLEQDKNG